MNDFKNNQSISRFADQLIRCYKIPFSSSKKDALNAVLNKIEEQQKKEKKQKKINRQIIAGVSVAAVILVVVAFWFFTASIKVSPGDKMVLSYRLPDDSRVVMQQQSEIKYKRYNWNRNVVLTGEAYFEVEKGEGFQVKTKLGNVEVLGTRFLVSDQNEKLSVMCFEGKVKTGFDKKYWILEPGTQFSGKKEDAKTEEFPEETKFPEFAKFQRNFSSENLADVMKEVEHFFNVDVEILTGQNKSFSGAIQTGSLENSLEIICGSLQLKYRFAETDKIEIYK